MKQKHIDLAHALRARGDTLQRIADEFNERRIATASGDGKWHRRTIGALLKKFSAPTEGGTEAELEQDEDAEQALANLLQNLRKPADEEDEDEYLRELLNAEREAYLRLTPEEQVARVTFADPSQHRHLGETIMAPINRAVLEQFAELRAETEALLDLSTSRSPHKVDKRLVRQRFRKNVERLLDEIEVSHQEVTALRQAIPRLEAEKQGVAGNKPTPISEEPPPRRRLSLKKTIQPKDVKA